MLVIAHCAMHSFSYMCYHWSSELPPVVLPTLQCNNICSAQATWRDQLHRTPLHTDRHLIVSSCTIYVHNVSHPSIMYSCCRLIDNKCNKCFAKISIPSNLTILSTNSYRKLNNVQMLIMYLLLRVNKINFPLRF